MGRTVATLGLWRGTALMVNIAVGAGILTLPGLAKAIAGPFAVLSWLISALIALPMVYLLIMNGQRYQEAGGIAAFVSRYFDHTGFLMTSFLFLGAVTFGLPSIALIGGHYLAVSLGGSAHGFALGLIGLAFTVQIGRVARSASINLVISITIMLVIACMIVIGFIIAPDERPAIELATVWQNRHTILAPVLLLFFAFTGWEVAAGLVKEFVHPKRDFPAAMLISFLLVCVIYFLLALVIHIHPIADHAITPFAKIMEYAIGDAGSTLLGVLAGLIILANLIGAIWAVSRLVVALAEQKIVPNRLARQNQGTPHLALIVVAIVLGCMVVLDWVGLLDLALMIQVAGQNFMLIFVLLAMGQLSAPFRPEKRAVAAAIKPVEYAAAGLVLIAASLLIYHSGQFLIWPGLLILAAIICHWRLHRTTP
ncbi:MAG: amino acid permease [Pseudomonadota bacterium]